METILYVAHTEADGSLSRYSQEVLGAAKSLADGLGATLVGGLIGADVAAAAKTVSGAASKVLAAAGDDFAQSRYSSDTAAIEAIAKAADATIIIGASDSRLARCLPGVAQRLGGKVDTQLTGLVADGGKAVATRWYYRQRMFAELSREERPWVLTLSSGCFEAFEGEGDGAFEAVEVALPELRSKVVTVESPDADEQTIRPDAETLFVAGAGWTKKQADGAAHIAEAEELILGFVNKAGASLGSSKSLVDLSGEGQEVLSCLTHMHQIGQTGATPRHKKGLATCCHGEEPHVVGWRFISERRAINTDAGCGWAQGKADVLYIADAFEVMKKVNELLDS